MKIFPWFPNLSFHKIKFLNFILVVKERFRMFPRVVLLILIIPSEIKRVNRWTRELRIYGASFTPWPSSVKLEIKLCQVLAINFHCTLSSCLSAPPHAVPSTSYALPPSLLSKHSPCFKNSTKGLFTPQFSRPYLSKVWINFSVLYLLISEVSLWLQFLQVYLPALRHSTYMTSENLFSLLQAWVN